jgi:hypothetical protein
MTSRGEALRARYRRWSSVAGTKHRSRSVMLTSGKDAGPRVAAEPSGPVTGPR